MGNIVQLLPIIFPLLAGILLLFIKMDQVQLKTYAFLTAGLNFFLVILVIIFFPQAGTLFRITDALSLRLMADSLSQLFVILVSVIWVLVVFYSNEYFSQDLNQQRFYAFFLMTLGTLTGVGFSANLLTFYLFYEMMTFITYPLVTHNSRPEAFKAGNKYLIYSLIGAQLSLIAMMGIFYFGSSHVFTVGGVLDSGITAGQENLVLLLFVLAVVGFGAKAGLFPLHAWLPIAHPVAPAPGSAVLSGLITKAGVIGIARMTYYIIGPDFIRGTWAHYLVLALVIISIFIGSVLAFRSDVLKVRLAYSSISQVGYVLLGILSLNLIGVIGGLLHMVFHAIIKNALFLSIGVVMRYTGISRVDEMDEVGKHMPVSMTTFTITSIALVGIPPLSGFVSKWYLGMGSLLFNHPWLGYLTVGVIILSAILTAAYLFPIATKAFFSSEGKDPHMFDNLEPKREMTWPLMSLATITVFFGLFPAGLTGFITNFIQQLF